MSCFFERINTIDKPLHSSLKRRDSQINKIRNEKGEIISHTTTEIQKKKKKRMLWTLYASKLNNLEEMDKFLESCNPLKLNQEGIDNLNRLTTWSEIESVKQKIYTSLQTNSGLDGFTREF